MIGRILFWVLWPVMWLVLPLTRRVQVIIMRGGTVLMVQQWIGPSKWELPGGGIKFGEKIEDAAVREMQEELAISCKRIHLLHDDISIHKKFGLLLRLHYVQAEIDPKAVISKNWEITESAWFPVEDLKNIIPSEVYQAIKL